MSARSLCTGWITAWIWLLLTAAEWAGQGTAAPAPAGTGWFAPNSLVRSPVSRRFYLAGDRAREVIEFADGVVTRRLALPDPPSGLALAPDGSRLFICCSGTAGTVVAVDLATWKPTRRFPAGHTAVGVTLSRDGRQLMVASRFEARLTAFDVDSGRERFRVAVDREPISLAMTPDDRWILVAHHLPAGRADASRVAAEITVIAAETGQVARRLHLPNGSTLLRDLRISPDGAYACVPHNLARYQMPTTQLDRGWMNTSALTLIRLGPLEVVNTVLLDDLDRGAANPWALAWTADGQRLCVSHAGTHELSVIDFPSLLERLDRLARGAATPPNAGYLSASRTAADVPQDLAFLVGLRQRVPLRGQGARALAVDGADVYVAHYFTDTLDTVRLDATPQAALETRLAPGRSLTPAERGEMLFNDGALSFQGWQSCATCHSEDGRIDGLNWDLLNDGIGNPKNSKTLLLSHRTPPAMSMGVRETAETAVRAGIRHILFATPEPGAAEAMDTWLKGLKAVPSPHLERGKLSPAAKRGRRLFDSSQTGCARCHPPGLFTDLQHYDVGTSTPLDREAKAFDTPSLIEVWRTAPYLHDGSASTLREVLTDRNRNDTHGRTSHLTPAQIDDLAEYVLSL